MHMEKASFEVQVEGREVMGIKEKNRKNKSSNGYFQNKNFFSSAMKSKGK